MTIIELKGNGYKTITQICKELHKDKDVNIPSEILQNGIKFGTGTYYPPEVVEKIVEYLNLPRIEKYKISCQRKYGVDNVSQAQEIKDKKSKTMLTHFGTDKSFELPQTKQAIKEKYGVDNISQNEEIKKRKLNTLEEHYGTTSGISLAKDTIRKKYGVENVSQNEEIKKKKRKGLGKKYFYDNTSFDSSWELAFYVYLKFNDLNFIYQPMDKSFIYEADGKQHTYFPDFKVDNNYIEIKGDHFFDKNGNFFNPYTNNIKKQNIAQAKYKCMVENNIIILREKDIKQYIIFAEEKIGDLNNYRKKKDGI